MMKKNETSYRCVFEFIKTKIEKAPKNFVTDFEIAPLNAFSRYFPETKINGCNFHFFHIIWWWIKKKQFGKGI
jgi:hypothetical protein